MGTIQKLNDIEIYRLSLDLARDVYHVTRDPRLKNDFSLVDQLRRACLSIPANIAEGYGRKSKRDFSQFLSIALGSVNEVVAFLDFVCIEYELDVSSIQRNYDILAKRIFAFRKYIISYTTHNP